MKIEGTYSIAAPRDAVWQHLMNPDTLAHSIPGCEKLVPNSDGSYHAEMRIGISSVKGTYHGRVEILDPVAPERYRMKVEGQGTGGFVRGEGTLTLLDGGAVGTTISYTGDAQVGGTIANVGQRLIQAAARHIVNHFFQQFAKQVQPSLPLPHVDDPNPNQDALSPSPLPQEGQGDSRFESTASPAGEAGPVPQRGRPDEGSPGGGGKGLSRDDPSA